MIINLKVFTEHCGSYTLSVRPHDGLSLHTQQCVACYRQPVGAYTPSACHSHLAYMVGFKAIGWYSIAECRATLALATLESKQFQLRMAFVSSAGGPFPLTA